MKFELGKVYSNPYARAFKSQQMVEDERDHEVGMAQGQLDYVIKSATELKGKLGNGEKNLPGWIQDHISKAHSYLHQANSGYHELDDKISVNESKHPHLKTNVKTDSDYSKVASILKSNKINYAWSAESGTLIFRDRFDMMKAEDLLGKKWLKETTNATFSSQNLITSLTSKVKKLVNDLKKKYPTANIDIVPNRYEADGSYTLSVSYKGGVPVIKKIESDIEKIQKHFNETINMNIMKKNNGVKLVEMMKLKESTGSKYKTGDVVNYIPKLSGLNPNKKLVISRVRYEDGDELTSPGWYYSFKGMNLIAHEKDIKPVSSIKESTEEPKIITQLRDVMKSGYKKLKCPKTGRTMTVDSYSASAIVKVYDALKDPKNKEKFSAAGLLGMQSMAFKLIK